MLNEKSDSGWIMVFVAVSLVVLCGFVALAVDVGSVVSTRTSAQRAADAGALAGAFTYVAGGDPTVHAVQTATSNTIMGAPISAGEVTVTFPASGQVQVTINHNAPIYFAKVLGIGIAPISATAIAEVAPNFISSVCTKPLYLPNTVGLSPFPCNSCPPYDTSGANLLINSAGAVMPVGLTLIGSSFVIQVKNATESLNSLPGQHSVFGATFSNDSPPLNPTQFFEPNCFECEPPTFIGGRMQIKTKTYDSSQLQASTIRGFSSVMLGFGTTDVYIGPGRYLAPDGNIYSTSRQLVTVPIFDVCSVPAPAPQIPPLPGFCDDTNADGIGDALITDYATQGKLPVIGFARMFATISGGQLTLRLVGLDGSGTAPPPSPASGPYGYPVRLVHN
jgi:hypothetical protein